MATVNSGMTLRVIPRTSYKFDALPASGTCLVFIAQHIDASTFTEADLLVRFHSGTIGAGGGTLLVGVFSDAYTFDDPSVVWSPPGGPLTGASPGTVTIAAADTAPYFQVATLGGPGSTAILGRLLSVGLLATQGTNAGAALNGVISIDLVLKGGDPAALPMSPNSFRGYRIQ